MAHEKVFKTVEEAQAFIQPWIDKVSAELAVVLNHTVTMMAITFLVGKMLVIGFMEPI